MTEKSIKLQQLKWSERPTYNRKSKGSSPFWSTTGIPPVMRAKRNLCWLGVCACALITGETSSKPKVSQKLSYIIPVEKSDAESVSGRGWGESCPCRNALPASGCAPTESVNAESHCSGGISSIESYS